MGETTRERAGIELALKYIIDYWLDSPNPGLRARAARTLGAVGKQFWPPGTTERLEMLTGDGCITVASAAGQALDHWIGDDCPSLEEIEQVVRDRITRARGLAFHLMKCLRCQTIAGFILGRDHLNERLAERHHDNPTGPLHEAIAGHMRDCRECAAKYVAEQSVPA